MGDRTIGRAARDAGVSVETIRFYERRGLIEQPSRPSPAGFRSYAPDQIEQVKFIRRAQHIGFSLREIQELLALRVDPSADCSTVRARATAKLVEVQHKSEQLCEIAAALESLIAACPGRGALRSCTILNALAAPGHEASSQSGADRAFSSPRSEHGRTESPRIFRRLV